MPRPQLSLGPLPPAAPELTSCSTCRYQFPSMEQLGRHAPQCGTALWVSPCPVPHPQEVPTTATRASSFELRAGAMARSALDGHQGEGNPLGRASMLSVRFKYVIGIGVGAGAYVLAKFAVSLPTTTPGPANPGLVPPGATCRNFLSSLPLLPPSTSSSLRKSFFLSFLQEINF